jgi:hypothetical protein
VDDQKVCKIDKNTLDFKIGYLKCITRLNLSVLGA